MPGSREQWIQQIEVAIEAEHYTEARETLARAERQLGEPLTELDRRIDEIERLTRSAQAGDLVARARALVRRAAGRGVALHSVGDLTLDTNRMTVAARGVPVSLTALEYRLMAYLVLNRDRVIPPTELLEHLYGDDDAREANALEAVIARLRRKLGPGVIGTRRGFGYFIEEQDG